jgi:molecular chaperone DnaJ
MVHVVVETPVKLTEHQKKLLKEFDASTQADAGKHSPKNKSWVDKAKDFFS